MLTMMGAPLTWPSTAPMGAHQLVPSRSIGTIVVSLPWVQLRVAKSAPMISTTTTESFSPAQMLWLVGSPLVLAFGLPTAGLGVAPSEGPVGSVGTVVVVTTTVVVTVVPGVVEVVDEELEPV